MIATRYHQIIDQIARAARAAGRAPEEVRLVVVTKGHPVEAVRAVIDAGAAWLGENYMEEAQPKIIACSGCPGVEWHMIGHVQSRKAQAVSELFSWVHSVDSLKLARRLDRFAGARGLRLRVLLECNVSGEESKYGWSAWDEEGWPALADQIAPILDLPNIEVRGLMTMAPYSQNPEDARPVFRRLRNLRDFLERRLAGSAWTELSMGMSGDFIPAIGEGATILRIGTAIMGPRPELG